jgi:hypothetical protein
MAISKGSFGEVVLSPRVSTFLFGTEDDRRNLPLVELGTTDPDISAKSHRVESGKHTVKVAPTCHRIPMAICAAPFEMAGNSDAFCESA